MSHFSCEASVLTLWVTRRRLIRLIIYVAVTVTQLFTLLFLAEGFVIIQLKGTFFFLFT